MYFCIFVCDCSANMVLQNQLYHAWVVALIVSIGCVLKIFWKWFLQRMTWKLLPIHMILYCQYPVVNNCILIVQHARELSDIKVRILLQRILILLPLLLLQLLKRQLTIIERSDDDKNDNDINFCIKLYKFSKKHYFLLAIFKL